MNFYSYITPLYPWGKKQEGGQEIFASDSLGKIDENKKVEITTGEVEGEFSKLLKEPNLDPKTQVSYINADKTDRKKYSSEDFKKTFISSGRYIVLTKNRDYVDPFGKLVGKKGQPSTEDKKPAGVPPASEGKTACRIPLSNEWIEYLKEKPETKMGSQQVGVLFTDCSSLDGVTVYNASELELPPSHINKIVAKIFVTPNINRSAVKMATEKDYFTGGFDIMKKLVKKQHDGQKIRKK